MDFVGPLPRTNNGFQYLVTAIDYGTAWACAIPLKKQSAKAAIEMVKSIILQFGLPEEITTDNGTEFDSYEFINFLKANLIQHNQTSPYHPRSNGLVERFHQTLISSVRKLVSPNSQNTWDEILEQALFGYRVSKNSTLGKSPYFLVHGIEPRLPHNPRFFGPVPPISSQEAELLYRKRNIDSKKLNIARQEAIKSANEKAERRAAQSENTYVEQNFKEGDLVLRRFEDRLTKLHPRWDGPFVIQDIHPNGSCVLMTSGGHSLRLPTNQDRLKHYKGDPNKFFYASADVKRRDKWALKRRGELSYNN